MAIGVGVITVSDSSHAGVRKDVSGDVAATILSSHGCEVVVREVVPDERTLISKALRMLCAADNVQCIVTTGGTGIGPRDVTPEATLDVVERLLPGMAEAMRLESLKKTPFAMISRQVVGVCGTTLIVNLPGSPTAVEECLHVILPVIPHAIELLHGRTEHTK